MLLIGFLHLYLCFPGSFHKQPVCPQFLSRTPIPEEPSRRWLALEVFQGDRHEREDPRIEFLPHWAGMGRGLRQNPLEGDALAYTRALVP